MQQRTIAQSAVCSGIGVHSGTLSQVVIDPAAADSGIVFVRADLQQPIEIPVRPDGIASARLATRLGSGEATIGTVEHLLAACFGLGVHNLRVSVDGDELPALDGSAIGYARLLRAAGLQEQAAPARVIGVREEVEVREGERFARIEPAAELSISYRIDFPHPAIGRQAICFDGITPECFFREIAPARSFGFQADQQALQEVGLARGANLENTLVFDADGLRNAEGLRWPDECVRHKVLDLIGDLALLGGSVVGRVEVACGGHALHQQLVSAIAAAQR